MTHPVLAPAEAARNIITRLASLGRKPRDPEIAAAALRRAELAEQSGDDVVALVEAAAAVEEYIDTTPWFHRSAVAATILCKERGLETLKERLDREEEERLRSFHRG